MSIIWLIFSKQRNQRANSTDMKLNLTGRKALVCGSTQGIGRAIAEELAVLGAELILMARNEDKLKDVVEELYVHHGVKHNYIVADFDRPNMVKAGIYDYLGSNDAPTILINNTGGPAPGILIEESYEKMDAALKAHLACNHILAQALVPHMKHQKFGRIINIVSTSVYVPIPGLGVSNTTRAAVAGWAKTLSIELGGYGITVNNVLPGLTSTDRLDKLIAKQMTDTGKSRIEVEATLNAATPAGRFGSPEEVAAMAAFLATPAAAYINGTSIAVDGGRTGCI